MPDIHQYRGCEIEVKTAQYTWGHLKGRWHGSFTIWRTPDGESHAMSGVKQDTNAPETEAEARQLALHLATAWIDRNWFTDKTN